MPDKFELHGISLTAPATEGFAISPDDVTDLPKTTRAIYVGSTGSLRVLLASGDEVTFANALAGSVYAIRVTKVFATSTTAGGLVGLV